MCEFRLQLCQHLGTQKRGTCSHMQAFARPKAELNFREVVAAALDAVRINDGIEPPA